MNVITISSALDINKNNFNTDLMVSVLFRTVYTFPLFRLLIIIDLKVWRIDLSILFPHFRLSNFLSFLTKTRFCSQNNTYLSEYRKKNLLVKDNSCNAII